MGYVEKITKQPARLEEAWNVNLVTKFFVVLKKLYCPSTIMSYWASQRCIRDYLAIDVRRCPKNYNQVNEQFEIQSKAGGKRRTHHLKIQKEKRVNDTEDLIRDIYINIYHNSNHWDKLNGLIAEFRECIKDGKPLRRLTQQEFCFVIGFLAWLIIFVNMKRSGNIGLLKLDSTSKALNEALTAYMAQNKGVRISQLPRKIDQKKVVPAVFEVKESKKKKETEYFCVLNPRDQRYWD